MRTHTTNYSNTFIQIADDCPATQAEIPPTKENKKSIATLQFEIISKNPYKYNSDDIIFKIYAKRNEIKKSELKKAREDFFSKGQPCLRTSPLTKRYGWGIHHDHKGKIALYGCETKEYEKFIKDKKIKIVKAMRLNKLHT